MYRRLGLVYRGGVLYRTLGVVYRRGCSVQETGCSVQEGDVVDPYADLIEAELTTKKLPHNRTHVHITIS